MMKNTTSRRTFFKHLGTAGLATVAGMPIVNANSLAEIPIKSTEPATYLIKNAQVLTMDPQLGDFESADILIQAGKIKAVGKNLADSNATIIDGKAKIALPGFVETHWHIWTSLMRAMAGSVPGQDYFSMSSQYGKLYTAENMYQSTRLALAEAISSGITHVHDWNHNILSAEHANASLKAFKEAGIRGRFSVGTASGKKDVDLNILKGLQRNWKDYRQDGLLSLGLAWPGIEQNRAAGKIEIDTARQLGLPISVHAGRRKDGSDSVSSIALAGLLGKDLQIVHGIDTTTAEYAQIAKAGATVSASPFSELRIGYGLTPAAAMLDSGAALGFSVDTMPLSGNADMFAIMKVFMNLADGMTRNEFKVTTKRVLEIATIEGARSMGISNMTGSISPGKMADLQLVNTQAINLGILTDPYAMLVLAAQPHNVDTVMVQGKILKKGGELIYLDINTLLSEASASMQMLKQRL